MGAIETGESAEAAARRELYEECGLTAAGLVDVGQFLPVPALMTQTTRVFIARISQRELESASEPHGVDDIVGIRRVNMSEVKQMIAASEIRDGSTLGAIALAVSREEIWATAETRT